MHGWYRNGADGAATYGTIGGVQTIRQPIKKKLQLIGSQLIVGVSGAVGLGQRIAGEVEGVQRHGIPIDEKTKKQLHQCKPYEVMSFLRHALWNIVGRELEIARISAQTFGTSALQSAIVQTAVSLLVGGEPSLFHFDHQGAVEQVTDDLPFVALGSGQIIADPFLAFIRRIFWDDKPPNVEQGLFAAVWAIQHAIETNAGGVGPPIQIVTFTKGKDKVWKTQEMPEQSNEERLQFIDALEKEIEKLPATMEEAKKAVPPPPA